MQQQQQDKGIWKLEISILRRAVSGADRIGNLFVLLALCRCFKVLFFTVENHDDEAALLSSLLHPRQGESFFFLLLFGATSQTRACVCGWIEAETFVLSLRVDCCLSVCGHLLLLLLLFWLLLCISGTPPFPFPASSKDERRGGESAERREEQR